MEEDSKYRSRKFLMTAAVEVVATIALFTAFLTGAEWITVTTLVLGIYNGANVWASKK
jgi:hypothetical protein